MSTFGFSLYGEHEKPNVYICEVDKTKIGAVVTENLTPDIKWNTYSLMSFTVPRIYYDIISGEHFVNPYYDKIESLRNIYVDGIGYFQIQTVDLQTDGITEYKAVVAHSYEVILAQKYLNDFQVNTGEITSIEYDTDPENIVPVRIYYPGHPERSLLDIVLEKFPDWTIGHVDESFTTSSSARVFDISRESVYDFLMNEVEPTIHGVFVFDTVENTISLYPEDTAGEDTDIFVSKDNLMKEVDIDYDCNDIKTALKVSGASDDVSIAMLNFGSDTIVDLTFYATADYMGEELANAYNAYLEGIEEKQVQYTELANEYNDLMNELVALQVDLILLQGYETSYKSIQQVQAEAGWAEEDNENYETYKANYDLLNETLEQINDKQAEIDAKDEEIAEKYEELSVLADEIDMDNNFTEEQLKILNLFIREDEYSDSCFAFTDNDTNDDKLETEQALLDAAKKELAQVSQPQLSFSLSMANIYAIPEFNALADMFYIGNFITVGVREDYFVHARIIEITFNYDDMQTFSVTFGNIYKSQDPVDIHAELMAQTSNVANKVTSSSSFWQKSSETANDVYQIVVDGLGTAVEQIKMSDDQDVTYDRYGLHLRKKADDAATASEITVDGYYKKQGWITNEKFMYTSDGWETAKSALGTITYNGQEVYGLIAEMVIAGVIIGSDITGGTLTGTTINNGNGTFYVDEDGNLTATSANITGDIYATGGTIGGFTITDNAIYDGLSSFDGTSNGVYIGTDGISLGGGKFKVDYLGNLTSTSADITGKITASEGTIGGFTITSSSIYNGLSSFSGTSNGVYIGTDGISLGGGKFSVDRNGNLVATSASITGSIEATGGAIGGWQISSTYLYKDTNDGSYRVRLNAPSSPGSSSRAIYIQNLSDSTYPFSVTYGGAVTATSVTVTGTINATGGTWQGNAVTSGYIASSLSGKTLTSSTFSGGTASGSSLSGCTVPTGYNMYYGSSNYYIGYNGVEFAITCPDSYGLNIESTSSQALYVHGGIYALGNISCSGSMSCTGTKSRVVDTKNYGSIKVNALETPTPTFADYGKATIAEDGYCYIAVEPKFAETIIFDVTPTVFLTKYGEGDIWVDKDKSTNTIVAVRGTPDLEFAWETRYTQTGVSTERCESHVEEPEYHDYGAMAIEYLKDYNRGILS